MCVVCAAERGYCMHVFISGGRGMSHWRMGTSDWRGGDVGTSQGGRVKYYWEREIHPCLLACDCRGVKRLSSCDPLPLQCIQHPHTLHFIQHINTPEEQTPLHSTPHTHTHISKESTPSNEAHTASPLPCTTHPLHNTHLQSMVLT